MSGPAGMLAWATHQRGVARSFPVGFLSNREAMASGDAATLSIAGLGGLTLALAMRMSAINIEQMQLARAAADPKRAAARFLQGTALLSPSPHSILSIRAIITIRLSRVPPSLRPLSSIACLSVCSLCLMSAVSCPLSPCLPVSLSPCLSFSRSLLGLPFAFSTARSPGRVPWGAFSRSLSSRMQRHVLQVVEPGATEQCRVRPNARRPHATDQVQGRAPPRAHTH